MSAHSASLIRKGDRVLFDDQAFTVVGDRFIDAGATGEGAAVTIRAESDPRIERTAPVRLMSRIVSDDQLVRATLGAVHETGYEDRVALRLEVPEEDTFLEVWLTAEQLAALTRR